MKTKNAADLRGLEVATLREKLVEAQDALFQKKLQHSLGKLENPASISLARRDIARIKTIITEKAKVNG
ncbi:MAG: 50S ribosomal protein L29 [Fibrobacteria bacterium]|nr:50S ribosomal protein L29 [Fibrobacteria bacterium]